LLFWPSIGFFSPAAGPDRLIQLRKAFMATVRDAEFLAEAKKTGQEIESLSGEEVERIVSKLSKLDPAFVKRLKEVVTLNN
jgi:hypothetical protein